MENMTQLAHPTKLEEKRDDILASMYAHVDWFTDDPISRIRAKSQIPPILEYLKLNFSNVKVGYNQIDLFSNSPRMRKEYLNSGGIKQDSILLHEIVLLLILCPFTIFPGASAVSGQAPNVYFQAKGYERGRSNGKPEVIITKGMHWHSAFLSYLNTEYKKTDPNGAGLFTILPTVTAIKEGQEFVNGKIETELTLRELRSDPVDAVMNRLFSKNSNDAVRLIDTIQQKATSQITAAFDNKKELIELCKKIILPEYLPTALSAKLKMLSEEAILTFLETKSAERDNLFCLMAKKDTSPKQIIQIILHKGIEAVQKFITDDSKKEEFKNTFLAALREPKEIVEAMDGNIEELKAEVRHELAKSYSKAPRVTVAYAVHYQFINHAPETIICTIKRLCEVSAGGILAKLKKSKAPEDKLKREGILNEIDEGLMYLNGKDPHYSWKVIKENYDSSKAPIEDMFAKTAKIRFFSWAGKDMFAGMMLDKNIMRSIEMAVDDVDRDNEYTDPERRKAIYKTTTCPLLTNKPKDIQGTLVETKGTTK